MLEKKDLFNHEGSDKAESQKIIGGNSTNLFNLNETKYNWAKSMFRTMNGNFWLPEKVDMSQDKLQYSTLTEEQKNTYKSILSFLTFLDSIQSNNIPNIFEWITSPEIKALLSVQQYQEVIHSSSYAYIIESVIPQSERNAVYDLWRDNELLFKRNKIIASFYQDFINVQNKKNLYRAIIANLILESIFFYNGFIFFYSLSVLDNKMMGTSDQIRYIQTDEECYVEGTEVLTNNGFVDFRNVNYSTKIAQFSLDDKNIDFVNPSNIIAKEYKGNVCRLANSRSNYESIVTENHDIVLTHRKTKLNFKTKAKNLSSNFIYEIPTAGYKKGNREFNCIDQLLIALQADGNLDLERTGIRSGYQVLHFAFNKSRKIERFKEILKRCEEYGIINTIHKAKEGYASFYVKYPNTLQITPDKNFDWITLDKVDSNYGKQFIEELKYWDGHIPIQKQPHHKKNHFYYSSINEKVIDKIQSIASLSGIRVARGIQIDDRSDNFSNVHRLYIYENSNAQQAQKVFKTTYEYEGNVYCVTVPTGAIITRYNGSVTVSGNCHTNIFVNIVNEIKNENDDFLSELEIYEMFKDACDLEIEWNKSIFQNNREINEKTSTAYIQHLANNALERIGMKGLYKKELSYNPYKQYEKISSSEQNNMKSNFFESTVTNYVQSSVLSGWDF